MLLNLLEATQSNNPWLSWVIMGVLLVVIIVFMILSRRSQKKKQQEQLDQLNAIGPGNKVKTIGGICGTVVNVKENKIVVETGADQVRIEFEKWAISSNETAAEAAKA
ncbi:MAG: preprotein translocase subunit YajC, partial [Clostridia bacterium]|nr:preprotein translocase subunit YajC [Clostridia bacterium]